LYLALLYPGPVIVVEEMLIDIMHVICIGGYIISNQTILTQYKTQVCCVCV